MKSSDTNKEIGARNLEAPEQAADGSLHACNYTIPLYLFSFRSINYEANGEELYNYTRVKSDPVSAAFFLGNHYNSNIAVAVTS